MAGRTHVATESYLREHWPAVERVAAVLMVERTLPAHDLPALVGDLPMLDPSPVTARIAAAAGVAMP